MKYINKRLWFAGMWIIFLLLWWRVFSPPQQQEAKTPNDWFYAQRAYPQGEINYQAYREGQRQVLALREAAAIRESASWQPAGPRNVGGRISDLELSPTSFDTIYAGTASGGIFRSVDAGNSWEPVFDGALSLSIGDLALDPANPRIRRDKPHIRFIKLIRPRPFRHHHSNQPLPHLQRHTQLGHHAHLPCFSR